MPVARAPGSDMMMFMSITPDAIVAAPADARPCLGCGYDLRGLGDEPRCPECGLLNVPQGYREEVWRLVDSGKWFFSGFFLPFKKRPPGWWWSLDRPGDVRRSWKEVARNAMLAAGILCIGCLAVDLFKVKTTCHWTAYDPNSAERNPIDVAETIYVTSFSRDGISIGGDNDKTWEKLKELREKGLRFKFTESRALTFFPRADLLYSFAPNMSIAVLLIWAYPATVGLYTQIRKSLPSFARPKRTIVAAANLESHQLIYNSALAIAMVVVIYAVRTTDSLKGQWRSNEGTFFFAAYACMAVLSAIRWIGAVRSDYTRQLIQSRSQAVRIVVLYGLIFPWATTLAILLLSTVFRGRALSGAMGI
ncbi:MAG: hypothetical protein HY287_08085 [Planctomycetes bacterium]|nr:hypothetical protein [Planctomycetota bacterium]